MLAEEAKFSDIVSKVKKLEAKKLKQQALARKLRAKIRAFKKTGVYESDEEEVIDTDKDEVVDKGKGRADDHNNDKTDAQGMPDDEQMDQETVNRPKLPSTAIAYTSH